MPNQPNSSQAGQEDRSGEDKGKGKGQQADKLEALIQDVDFSDVPEGIREQVKKATAEKVHQYDKGFRAKTESLAEKEKALKVTEESLSGLKTIQKELQDDPKLAEVVNKVYYDYKSGKLVKPKEASSAVKKLDKLIEGTDDADQREQLRDMRDIIKEEAGEGSQEVSDLKEEIKRLKEEIGSVKDFSLTSRTERVNSQIEELKDRFGKEVVEKYEKDIQFSAIKYPHQTVLKLFYHFADENDIKSALLTEEKQKEKKELERKKQGAFPSFKESSTEKIEPPRDKAGRVNMRNFLSKIIDKHGIKAP